MTIKVTIYENKKTRENMLHKEATTYNDYYWGIGLEDGMSG